MTTVADLTPAELRALKGGHARPAPVRVRVKSASPSGVPPLSNRTAPGGWRCHRCGQAFTAYAPAERHARDERHHRIEVLLQPAGGV